MKKENNVKIDGKIVQEKEYKFYVEKIAKEYKMSFLDACVYLIECYDIDPKVLASHITSSIKEKIKNECIELNKLKIKKA